MYHVDSTEESITNFPQNYLQIQHNPSQYRHCNLETYMEKQRPSSNQNSES